MLTLSQQVYLLLVTLVCGFILGFFFDIYRIIRWVVKPNKMSTFIGDLIYWLLMTALVFKVLLLTSYGEVRLYVFISLALGGYLYFSLLSRFVLKILQKLLLLLSKLIGKLVRFIRIIFRKMEKAFNRIADFLFLPFKKLLIFKRKIEGIFKKILSRIPLPKFPKPKIRRKKVKKEGLYSIGRKEYGRRKRVGYGRNKK